MTDRKHTARPMSDAEVKAKASLQAADTWVRVRCPRDGYMCGAVDCVERGACTEAQVVPMWEGMDLSTAPDMVAIWTPGPKPSQPSPRPRFTLHLGRRDSVLRFLVDLLAVLAIVLPVFFMVYFVMAPH